MPVSKTTLQEKKIAFELEEVEFTVGSEQVIVRGLKGSIDVASFLNSVVPEHIAPPLFRNGPPPGTGIYMRSYGNKKIQVIKEMRSLTGLGLKEAKELTEQAPVLIEASRFGLNDLDEAGRALAGAGAEVELVEDNGDPVPPPPQPTVLNLIQKWLVKVSNTETEE